jgi:general secretion pathway protein J
MKRVGGFTLVELLLALFAMALMAGLGWQALDGMIRAQAAADARARQVQVLQAGIAQWIADLDALEPMPQASGLDWDGRVLRLTRRTIAGQGHGMIVVAWTEREGQWLRWQSLPLASRGEVNAAWERAALWARRPGEPERHSEVSITPLTGWRLYYFRGNTWSHPLSSDGVQTSGASTVIPDGVRLELDLPRGEPLSGRIVRDWASPKLAGARS